MSESVKRGTLTGYRGNVADLQIQVDYDVKVIWDLSPKPIFNPYSKLVCHTYLEIRLGYYLASVLVHPR